VLNPDCGIYTITSPSGKQYVGSAVSFKNRWRTHLRHLRGGAHHCKGLQRAFDKYGEGSLVFAKVALVPKKDLIAREQEQLDARDADMLYNSYLTAGSALGTKHSDEFKEKCRQRMLGNVQSDETKMRRAESHRGQKRSPETKAKIGAANSAALTGKKLSEEHKKKIGEASKGKKHTEEARAKMSIAMMGKNTGKKHSKETREKLSAALKGKNSGRPCSAEKRAKLSAALKGRTRASAKEDPKNKEPNP
jgi:group I intron endonuclease